MKRILIIAFLSLVALAPIAAQKFSVAYVDMQYILKNLPQYETANEQLNMISKRWQKDIDAALKSFTNVVSDTLQKKDKVQLIGFGTFEVKATAEREGRNPKTGEAIKIAAAKKPSFSASKVLKDEVNA